MGKDSDVYVYSDGTYLICCGCSTNFLTGSISEMLNHLREHKNCGDKVPSYAIKRLISKRNNFGDIV